MDHNKWKTECHKVIIYFEKYLIDYLKDLKI